MFNFDKNLQIRKANIEEILGKKKYETAEDFIEKAEGSKGGKVIGHTKSGKPIYENANHASHKDFTSNDHRDAKALHYGRADELREKQAPAKRGSKADNERIQGDKHHKLASEKRAVED